MISMVPGKMRYMHSNMRFKDKPTLHFPHQTTATQKNDLGMREVEEKRVDRKKARKSVGGVLHI